MRAIDVVLATKTWKIMNDFNVMSWTDPVGGGQGVRTVPPPIKLRVSVGFHRGDRGKMIHGAK